MADILQASVKNTILSNLSDEDFTKIRPDLQTARLNSNEVLIESDAPIDYAYFVESGVSSIIMSDESDRKLGIAVIGREGMAGVDLLHGLNRSSHQIIVQIAGSALRLPANIFQSAINDSPSFRISMLLFAHKMFKQSMRSALVQGRYMIKQRLARLLVMYHDRLNHDDLPLTHQLLSLMVSAHRPGVTTSLHELVEEGGIKISRQLIHVRDRDKLIESAGGCYGALECQIAGVDLRQSHDDLRQGQLTA